MGDQERRVSDEGQERRVSDEGQEADSELINPSEETGWRELYVALSSKLILRLDTIYCFKSPRKTTYPVSYTHLRAHETDSYLVCRLLLEKKKKTTEIKKKKKK